jgi:eukaryotic-like serine/threonine-protein kinase
MRMPRFPRSREELADLGANTLPPDSKGAQKWHDSITIPFKRSANAAFSGIEIHNYGALPTVGQIGRYALKYQVGSGGLGQVFAAHDPLLSRLIAIKTLTVDISAKERDTFNAQFLKEARASAGLSHPNIVTVFDAGISSDRKAYIAMELLKGRDLRQLRQEGWRPTVWQAVVIVRRVADALAYAHSKGIIHCDVKPANIFMVGRTQPRVLDFGIARITHQRDADVSHVEGGSPYYMSPEQVRQEHIDRRSDVFSLGVVLYELLTNQKPFRGESLGEITHGVTKVTPPSPYQIDPKLPKALSDIVMRAMEKEVNQRFRSARALSRELRAWLEANPQSSMQPETAVPGLIKSKKMWRVVGVLLLLGVIGATLWRMKVLEGLG